MTTLTMSWLNGNPIAPLSYFRIHDPSFTDHLARLNRITSSLSQHVSTLSSYSKRLTELDERQKAALEEVNEAKALLERDAQARLNSALPEIREQNKIMTDIERKVELARMKLEEQSDTVTRSVASTNVSWRISTIKLLRIGRICRFLLLQPRISSRLLR